MKPAWDKLMETYKDSKDYLIADVDCTAKGKLLCQEHKVRGYPTLKAGYPDDRKFGWNYLAELASLTLTS